MYSSLVSQLGMNGDAHRNSLYSKAISQLVHPGDRVIDLGAGLGMLGFLAARQGASVHFVEPQRLLSLTGQVASANGIDGCHFHQCRGEELMGIGPVDAVISVFTGNFLLTEDLLPSLFRVRDRFLAPGGRLIPHRARMVVQPVSCPVYYQQQIELPTKVTAGDCSISYATLRQHLVNTLYYEHFNDIDYVPLGPAEYFHDMDFYTAQTASCNDGVVVVLDQDSVCHGWIGWFEMALADAWLSTGPAEPKTHWRQVFLPLREPMKVEAGDSLSFHLHRPERGEWTWTTRSGEMTQRMSTFLSEAVDPDKLRKGANHYRPKLTQKGEAARWVLEQFAGERTLNEICEDLMCREPALFPSREETSDWLRGLVSRFG